ncbi:MAG TPA: nucleotide disphospho-sugar-binding domain-containing protein, partial [Miltoncostaea sp.]|nr:nucleotide disphospho-sugar-binding domain-containing protein [Miltoncostaea sp.]
RVPGVLATALEGLRGLRANVVVTCGPDVDPATLGPQPPHVLVAPYLPHALLLPRCDLVVSQGGAGIMLGALLHGVPHLMLPQGADQFIDADVCTRAGAALAVAPDAFGSDAVRAGAARLLGEPSFAAAAARLGAAVRAMPAPARVLAELAGGLRRSAPPAASATSPPARPGRGRT